VGAFCVCVAVAGCTASIMLPRTEAAGSSKKFTPLFLVEIFRTLRSCTAQPFLLFSIVAASFFLYEAAFLQQNMILHGQAILGLSWFQSVYLFTVTAAGIGVGAIVAGRLSGRSVELGIFPIGAVGIVIASLAAAIAPPSLWTMRVIVFFMGVSTGLYIVPLNAYVQLRSPTETRGEVLASLNFLSFSGVALAAGSIKLFGSVLGLDTRQGFLVVAVLMAGFILFSFVRYRFLFVRFAMFVVTRCFFPLAKHGVENVPEGGALLVSNHVTWFDPLFIHACLHRRTRFLVDREIHSLRCLRWLFPLVDAIPVSASDPPGMIEESLAEARRCLDEGHLVCIFGEGLFTRTGNLRGFRPGMERIVRGSSHPIIPIYLGEMWGSIFSFRGDKMFWRRPHRMRMPVTVVFGRPLPSSSSTAEVRRAVLECSATVFDLRKKADRCLPLRFIRAARKRWSKPGMSDTTGKSVTFGRALVGAVALAGVLRKRTRDQQMVGLLLPSSVGGALANLALSLLGKVAVNLNFTASRDALRSAIEQCGISTVVSSRAFLKKFEGFEAPEGTILLEDVAKEVTTPRKIGALLKARLLPARLLCDSVPGPDDLATVVFSSGSTGEPKGVMLTHHNILSNIEAFLMVFPFTPQDGMCALLPFFHSFGFTCTMWCPLLSGFRVHYHPNPLDAATVASMVREEQLTVLLATPTFLGSYMRKASAEDFRSLRSVIVGAEKLREKTADAFEKKFGVRPLEGYGTTELAPVASLNVPDAGVGRGRQTGNKHGSIGHPIPGVAMKIVDAESYKDVPDGEEGLLMVKGPNVMKGYLGMPEKTSEVIVDGWYDTGDIGTMDKDGFVRLVDRASRFSKIGGEMVPHIAIEDALTAEMDPELRCVAVSAVPDERRGEQVVVLFTGEAGSVEDLLAAVSGSDLPNLWRPRKDHYFQVEELPMLGSGKLDIRKLKELALEHAGRGGGGDV
ncbi:MAG: MFS transporter, partial [Lentisphaerae bacterium]|nr:MFS transporter [Lentisphaerota bacterium]